MSNYVVTARVIADVGQYNAAMRGAATTTGQVGTQADATGQKANRAFGIARVGGVMFATVVARELKKTAGAGIEFESAMTKIVSLVGVAHSQVDEWADSFRTLGPALGAAQTELADAMFFITSAGLRGSEAMDVLEASTMAAKAGLGEISTVADAATSAMNAYGAENLSADRAVSILVATVREGKMAPEELAGTLGRVIPLAAELGITFDQVGATLAVMTRTGLGAAEATTAMRGIMSTLIKPTNEAQEALEGAGLSMAGLREIASGPDGILGVLTALDAAFGGNVEAMGEVVPNVRALTGVLNVLGQDGESTAGVFDRLAASTDDHARAFMEWSDTAEASIDKFMAKVDAMRTSAGDDMSDTMKEAADAGTLYLEVMDRIPNKTDMVLGAMGPQGQAFAAVRGHAADARRAVLDFINGLTGGTDASENYTRELDRQTGSYTAAARASWAAKEGTDAAGGSMSEAARSADELNSALAALSDPFLNMHRATERVEQAQTKYNEAVAEHGKESAEANTALMDLTSSSFDLIGALNNLEEAQENGESSATQMKAAIDVLAQALGWSEEQADAAKAAIDEVQSTANNLDGTSAQVDVIANTSDATAAINRYLDLLGRIPAQLRTNIVANAIVHEVTGVRRQSGGIIPGTGSGDIVPALLEPGEFVLRKQAVNKLGQPLLEWMNAARFQSGGRVSGPAFQPSMTGDLLSATMGGSSFEISAAVNEVLRLVAAWEDMLTAQAHAERRLELLAQRAEAERRLAEASTAEEKAAAQAAVDSAIIAIQRLDEEHAQMGRRREIEAQIALALEEERIAANRERWEFDRMTHAEQLRWLDERLAGEREFSDEWMRLQADRERIAQDAHRAELDRIEKEKAAAKQAADERQRAVDEAQREAEAALANLNRLLDQRDAVRGRMAERELQLRTQIADRQARHDRDVAAAMEARNRALDGWVRVDERAMIGMGASARALSGNIERQMQLFTMWVDGLADLRDRGVSEDVIEALGLADSPEAVGQIRALARATDAELADLNAMVAERNRQAAQQTKREAESTHSQLNRTLTGMRAGFNDDLAALHADFNADMEGLREELAKIGQDNGRSFAEAVAEGLRAGIPGVLAAARELQAAMNARDQAQQALSGGGSSSSSGSGGATGPTRQQTAQEHASRIGGIVRQDPSGRYVVFADGVPIRTYHSGADVVPGAGDVPAILQGGERIFSTSQNAQLVAAVNRISAGPQSITVYMPPGANGEDVVNALKRWSRRNGPVPVTVRG